MFFGGIQKTSLIDFPGKISCVLFTPGCNFTCPYCHNPELAKNETDKLAILSKEEVLAFLSSRQGLIEGVAITGGEPTLQPELASFLADVKNLGYPIKLDTNGSRPKVLKHLLKDALLDYIAMDIKTDPENYAPQICKKNISDRITDSIQTILHAGIAHEFRTTCLAPFINIDTLTRIARWVRGADLYVLQQLQTKAALDPAYMENHAGSYSDETLEGFRQILAPFVKQCTVR